MADSNNLGGLFLQVVTTAARKHRSKKKVPTVPLSLAPMVVAACVTVDLPVAGLSAFLDEVGRQMVKAGVPDVQLWVQRRREKGSAAATAIWGAVIDVDRQVSDVLAAVEEAGVPMPNVYWHTRNGHKLLYAFDREATLEEARHVATWLTLALAGGDPGSWSMAQGQHLPICLKTTADGTVEIDFAPTLANPAPLALDAFPMGTLPLRLRRILGMGASLGEAERRVVRALLEEKGIPAPEESGRALFAACPVCASHDSKCCYVNCAEDGAIHVVCLGGHDGEGKKAWTEVDLYGLATGAALQAPRIDAVVDVPATFAGRQYREHRLRVSLAAESYLEDLVKGGERLWLRAKAEQDLRDWRREAGRMARGEGAAEIVEPSLEDVLDVYRRRGEPWLGLGPVDVYFDQINHEARIFGPTPHPLHYTGDTLSLKSHEHEWRASQAHRIGHDIEKDGGQSRVVGQVMLDKRFSSHFNKAVSGHPGALASLGLASISHHEFPIAFVTQEWRIDLAAKTVIGTILPQLKPGNPNFDTLEFFTHLYKQGRLPFASEKDVPRFVMEIASPLLRYLAPGLLGIYWQMGPPGVGKDFMAEIPPAIYQAAMVRAGSRVKFDLNDTDDLEQKRAIYAAGPALYCRAKEAAKRKRFIELLIRFAGTEMLTGRGMRRDEVPVLNTFTLVADSAEDLPALKEISRRTVIINLAGMDDDDVSKGGVLQEILRHAPDIVGDLIRRVESKPASWYLEQADTDSRPIVPAALAKLFGAELPKVVGRSLDELFEALLTYIEEELCGDEGENNMKSAIPRYGKLLQLLPSYKVSHFSEVMAEQAGYRTLAKELGTSRQLKMALCRETNYPRVMQGQLPYLRVEIKGRPYAFKLVRDDQRFVLEPELKFCSTLGIQPIEPSSPAAAKEPVEEHHETAARPRERREQNPLSLSEEELLDRKGRGRA